MKEVLEIVSRVPVKWSVREDIYPMLGPGGLGVEIGVRRGLNARSLFDIARPDKMFLIDPWQGELKRWKPYGKRKTQEEWDKNCAITTKAFGAEIRSKRVQICRRTATDMRDVFPLESLSWVYVDGNHMFAHAFSDLYYYYRRIRSGGYLLAHDFTIEVANGNVVLAVDLLVKMYPGIKIIGRSNESCPTIVMQVFDKEEIHWPHVSIR
jgi:hypothetical protein